MLKFDLGIISRSIRNRIKGHPKGSWYFKLWVKSLEWLGSVQGTVPSVEIDFMQTIHLETYTVMEASKFCRYNNW